MMRIITRIACLHYDGAPESFTKLSDGYEVGMAVIAAHELLGTEDEHWTDITVYEDEEENLDNPDYTVAFTLTRAEAKAIVDR